MKPTVFVLLATSLLATPATRADEVRKVSVCIGAFYTEGLKPGTIDATKKNIVDVMRALGAEVATAGKGFAVEKTCYDAPDCLRKAAASLDVDGVLDIRILRFGPMLRVAIRTFDARSGVIVQETASMASADGFPGSVNLRPDLERSLTALRAKLPKEPKKAAAAKRPPPKKPPPKMTTIVQKTPPPAPKREITPPPAGVEKQAETGSSLDTWGWVAVGTGGALIVAGAVTGGMAYSINSDLKDKCTDGFCAPQYIDDRDKRDTLALTTDVLIGIGAATVVAGVLILTVFDSDDDGETSVELRPAVAPGYTGAAIQGRF